MLGTEDLGPAVERPVGRDAEVQRLLHVVQQQGASLVVGAAGIGKTLVLRELARRLSAADADVLTLSGTEATATIPLAPLLRLCPPGAEDAGTAIMAELYRRSRRTDLAVLVDDAHLLDEATAAVVRQMAAAPAFGVVVAARSGETLPTSIASIHRDGHAVVQELTELDRTASRQLVERLLGPTEADTVEWLRARTRGHPLYLRELVVAGQQSGALRRRDGRWRHTADAPVWTARLHALVATRLRGLTPEERLAMQLVAVGDSVPLGALSAIVDLDVLVDLASRRLLAVDATRVRMDHPLVSETLLATMRSDQVTAARRRLADVLEAHPEDADPVAIAQLRLDAGQTVTTARLLEAADTALTSHLPQVAERFARAACHEAPDPAVRMRLVESLAMQRRWEEAEEQLEQVVATSSDDEAVAHLERWVAVNFEYRDRLATSRQIAARAQARIGDRGSVAWEVLLLRVGVFASDLDTSIVEHDHLLATRRVEPRLREVALVDIARCASHSGAFHRVRTIASELRDGGVDPVEQANLRGAELLVDAWVDGWPALAGRIDGFLSDATATANPDLESLAHLDVAMALNALTRHAQAVDHLMAVVELDRYVRQRRHVPLALAELARALLATTRGRQEAAAWLERAAALPDEARWTSEPIVQLVAGLVAHDEGRDPWPALERGLEHARQRAARTHEVRLLRHVGLLGRPDRAVAALQELVPSMGGGLTALVLSEAEALAARDADMLDQVASEAIGFGATGIALDASTHAAGLHVEAGRAARAFTAQHRAEQVSRRAPRQRSLITGAAPPVLSSRERQVVAAISDGASNRDAADRLFISHRTVESHLRRIYKRLDVSGREELLGLVEAARQETAGAPDGETATFSTTPADA